MRYVCVTVVLALSFVIPKLSLLHANQQCVFFFFLKMDDEGNFATISVPLDPMKTLQENTKVIVSIIISNII